MLFLSGKNGTFEGQFRHSCRAKPLLFIAKTIGFPRWKGCFESIMTAILLHNFKKYYVVCWKQMCYNCAHESAWSCAQRVVGWFCDRFWALL